MVQLRPESSAPIAKGEPSRLRQLSAVTKSSAERAALATSCPWMGAFAPCNFQNSSDRATPVPGDSKLHPRQH